MHLLDRIAERRIEEAIRRGDLDDLPGAGRPLPLDDDVMVPEELRVAYRILKNAGCVPPELETRREIYDVRQLLACVTGAARSRAVQRLQYLLMQLSIVRGSDVSFDTEVEYVQRIHERLTPIQLHES